MSTSEETPRQNQDTPMEDLVPQNTSLPVAGLPVDHQIDETTRRNLFGQGLPSFTGQNTAAQLPNVGVPVPVLQSAPTMGPLPEKFDGQGFKSWQLKMIFFLTNLQLEKFVKEDQPYLPPGNTDKLLFNTVEAWKHSDYLCKGWILNCLENKLFKVYCDYKTSKALWTALEKKYRVEDAGCQKYAVAKFLNFTMVDSKPVMQQVEAFQLICQEVESEGMSICEPFTVNTIIEKLPSGWHDFKNYLKHKRKKMSLEDLLNRLQTEERNRGSLSNSAVLHQHDVHMVEYKPKGKDKGKGKAVATSSLKPTSSTSFKKQSKPAEQKKFKGKCHNCGKLGHKSDECRSKPKNKGKKNDQVNLTEEHLCA